MSRSVRDELENTDVNISRLGKGLFQGDNMGEAMPEYLGLRQSRYAKSGNAEYFEGLVQS